MRTETRKPAAAILRTFQAEGGPSSRYAMTVEEIERLFFSAFDGRAGFPAHPGFILNSQSSVLDDRSPPLSTEGGRVGIQN
jgi:hypothetical protein